MASKKPYSPSRRKGNAQKSASRKAASAARDAGASRTRMKLRILNLVARVSVIETRLGIVDDLVDAEEE